MDNDYGKEREEDEGGDEEEKEEEEELELLGVAGNRTSFEEASEIIRARGYIKTIRVF